VKAIEEHRAAISVIYGPEHIVCTLGPEGHLDPRQLADRLGPHILGGSDATDGSPGRPADEDADAPYR